MKFSRTFKVAFDTETTGVDVKKDRIVTAAVVQTDPDGKVLTKQEWMINPGIPIPEAASKVHGVSTERARAEGVMPSEALPGIAWALFDAMSWGMPIVAFNLAFDWSILYHELLRYRMNELAHNLYMSEYQRLVDPLIVDKHCDRYRKGERRLGAMCKHYGVEIENWHDATADAHAAVLVATKMFEKFWYLDQYPPAKLYESQQKWRKEQIVGLQAYHEMKQGKKMEEDYDYRWPLMD